MVDSDLVLAAKVKSNFSLIICNSGIVLWFGE